ncbi:hypothetical protein HYALB_00003091 [Hymenoscyphus albidus]|uniref:Rho1 guanine nucleotide exchange factor 3 n=1 Tax=Hymenoscyphus albidus TaxID=595503 RepID=A0A9N9LVB8_9HELO|nr:hypothetical protein HYALB_00003091 [Hymenoscyphus albidus]
MSQRRYGHVPPAQYGAPGAHNHHNSASSLHRQSSFDNGDDAPYFEQPNRYQGGLPPTPAPPGRMAAPVAMPQEERYLASPTSHSQSSRSPGRSSFGSASPALSGYQHQYQPFPTGSTPTSPGLPYSPQQFARAQSQSVSHRPQPAYNNTPPTPSTAHQPYNPAAYQAPTQQPMRHATVSGHGSYNQQYTQPISMPQVPQSTGYYPPTPQQQYSSPPSRPSPQTMYENPISSPTYSVHNPTSPSQPSYQLPTTIPYPTNGGNFNQIDRRPASTTQAQYPDYSQYGSYDDEAVNRLRSTANHHATASLGRHPTLRPLPSAPAEPRGDNDDWGLDNHGQNESEEDVSQEQLFADIGDALGASSPRHARSNGDLLDGEFHHGISRYGSRASAGATSGLDRYASTASNINPNNLRSTYGDYEDEEESDLEAAAGLEAMRIAEEQERGGGPLSFGGSGGQESKYPLSGGESSDSDYKHQDLSLVGGGYPARMSYGHELAGMNTGNSSEMEDQSRPLPTPHDLGTTDSYNTTTSGLGGMTDYSIPGEGAIHPFPAFDTTARVDTSGTGGLQRPSSQPHRLSFDEGDEHSLQLRDSRLSGSDSPTRDDMPELFYHPGISTSLYNSNLNRPLPVPPMSENRTPQLMPAGTYRNTQGLQHSYSSSSDMSRPSYAPNGPDSYPPQNMLSPGGQFVPRSTSLSSHSSTPHTVPPTRSKTDAEERQARQKAARMGMRGANGLDGYDTGTPQSSVALDLPALPAGRRKKFGLAKLSSQDFKRCHEPWALSDIAAWIREMAGGETGEGESDLREKAIEEGLVSLFTHKVPTMNTADAETLSQRVIKTMLAAGILVPDEEWVKLGQGSVSGVLWQLTGSGCYSPKVHEHEVPGRCYSHHCTRTLKKINLNAQVLEPSKKTEDWVTFFKMTKEQIESVSKKDVELQNNLHEIVMSEDLYMEHINVLRVLYRDHLATWQPPIIAKSKLPKFIASVFGKVESIKEVNENHLLPQLKYRQKEQGPWVVGYSDIFREWIRKARTAYIEYAAGFPFATYLVRREADKNLLFRQFLDQARENKLSSRLDWDTYLKAPITRLQRYGLLLDTIYKNMKKDSEEKTNLAKAIEEIKQVTHECDAKVNEQTKKVEMVELQSKLHLRPGMERVELNLDHLGRELIFKGDLQRAGVNKFNWVETHTILFDHYLVLSKKMEQRENTGRKREVYDVSKLPIPMQLLVLESSNDDPVVKTVRAIGAVTVSARPGQAGAPNHLTRITTTNGEVMRPLEHTTSNTSVQTMTSVTKLNPTNANGTDARYMYPFRVKHLGKNEVYTLYAPSAANRQDWCDKILEAKTRHAASLYEQSAEPFRLRVMADTAFGNDALAGATRSNVVFVKGTPLERSIRDMERTYGAGPRPGPVCRAQVNCATAFNCFGKAMVAIGTDYGVYISEATNPRGWSRSIQIAKVTQIAVLEEFSLCIIISDKALIAYHLDVIVPVSNFPAPQHDSGRKAPQKLSGNRDVSFFATARMKDRTLVFYKKREGLHSTFKVLEPVFQKSTEKKSRLFGKLKGGTTEFFREYDEFYIPTECFTINLFHSYIAISTLKGFELMTLDKKVPMSIPDVKNPAIGNIASRLRDQKPLGMFRLSDSEFLLAYEECAVYVDKHGEVSRSVIMEFVGRAAKAAMYGAYLVLFDNDFVEVRNAENGRLRQVIAGQNVRCLDYGINPLGAGAANSQMTPVTFGGGGGAEKRTLKLAMAHPEVPANQIVLEMVLNEGHFE